MPDRGQIDELTGADAGPAVVVRRMAAEDFALLRRLRLAALADAPFAFSSRLADEQTLPESAWRGRAASNAEGQRSAGFFAVVDGHERGLAVGLFDDDAPETAQLVSMWVAPEGRRRGAARALVEAVCAWAEGRGCRELALMVTEINRAAIALYRACGFGETGKGEQFPPDPSIREVEMRRPLAG